MLFRDDVYGVHHNIFIVPMEYIVTMLKELSINYDIDATMLQFISLVAHGCNGRVVSVENVWSLCDVISSTNKGEEGGTEHAHIDNH